MRAKTQIPVLCLITVLLITNTSFGCFWLNNLRLLNDDETGDFKLKHEYLIELFILLMVPLSVFVFLTIVIIKFICFQLFEQRKKSKKRAFTSFNEEEENPDDINSVVGVYMRAIETITYEHFDDENDPSAIPTQKRFMVF